MLLLSADSLFLLVFLLRDKNTVPITHIPARLCVPRDITLLACCVTDNMFNSLVQYFKTKVMKQ